MDASRKKKLARQVFDACHTVGEFKLRSGRIASDYFDKYQLSTNAELLFSVTREMNSLLPLNVEVVAGLEMGAIPLVTMISFHSKHPAAFVRKKAKDYGTARLSEGASVNGRRVLVIEDVVTSGGQVISSVSDLRNIGATVTHVLAVIDREEGARQALLGIGIDLLSLFKRSDFESL